MLKNEPQAATLLDEINDALLQRNYGQLQALTKSLQDSLDQSTPDLDAAALAVIRSKADRNATTLSAVQRGIKAAIRRIAEIRSVAEGLVTYDKSGRKLEPTAKGLAQRL